MIQQTQIELIYKNPPLLRLQTAETTWLMLTGATLSAQKQIIDRIELLPKLKASILWWTGEELLPEFLKSVQPKMAIASTPSKDDISDFTLRQLQNANIDVYQTGRDGAIQWSHSNSTQVQPLKEQEENQSPI